MISANVNMIISYTAQDTVPFDMSLITILLIICYNFMSFKLPLDFDALFVWIDLKGVKIGTSINQLSYTLVALLYLI